jgi:hypothetical protein
VFGLDSERRKQTENRSKLEDGKFCAFVKMVSVLVAIYFIPETNCKKLEGKVSRKKLLYSRKCRINRQSIATLGPQTLTKIFFSLPSLYTLFSDCSNDG